MKRTEGPWEYQERSDAYTHIIRGPNGIFITQLSQDTSGKAEANARFIVTACNNHDALVDALTALLNFTDAFGCFRDDIGEGVKRFVEELLAKIRAEQGGGE